ncbi:hypothetical protein [Hymenobacter cellulosivorans]|uniref:Uncharacterized protein n=1 Tax=Hymenobacter cellulosivorans TaxID=2932249 RepID=A0ABY4FC59_9BACT|nr:hypothetical protein [Hymenobacter cellulosivorans]UOQ53534.1 hypothetical protein MUN80_01960 [Hymenobacter cellulosivorans]
MTQLLWRISAAPPGTWDVLGLRVESTFSAEAGWPAFFNGIPAGWYPTVIEAAVQEVGAASNAVGVSFPGDLDAFDLTQRPPIPADAVEIYCHSLPVESLPRVVFYQILLAFGSRLAECPGQPPEWYLAMHTALQKLRRKLGRELAA